LLTNPTKEAAAKAGIESRTLRRYLADPDFQAEYQRAVSGMIEDAAAQAKQSLYPALSALRAIIEDGAETASARIQAARTVLEYGLRLTDIMKQLDELEKWRDATDGKHERAARSVAGVH
jgi:hypothetical protein